MAVFEAFWRFELLLQKLGVCFLVLNGRQLLYELSTVLSLQRKVVLFFVFKQD